MGIAGPDNELKFSGPAELGTFYFLGVNSLQAKLFCIIRIDQLSAAFQGEVPFIRVHSRFQDRDVDIAPYEAGFPQIAVPRNNLNAGSCAHFLTFFKWFSLSAA